MISGFHTRFQTHFQTRFQTRVRATSPAVMAVLMAGLAAPARGQASGDGFLFGTPSATLTLQGGYVGASGRGDFFAFNTRQLTLNRRDFNSPFAGADLAIRAGARTDVVLSASYAGMNKTSEFRDFVDQNNAPIIQSTAFQRVPLTVNLRQYLTPRGRQVGRLAWIPATAAVYTGIGAGAMWYRFRQNGDFVDYKTNAIFPAILTSTGWAPAARAFAGADLTLSPRLALNVQGAYLWARARPGSDYYGFNSIDLSGVTTTMGLAVRF